MSRSRGHRTAGTAGPGDGSQTDRGGRRGPDVLSLTLGLLGLVVGVLALLRELAGVGPAGEWVAPTAALAVGGVLVVVGVVGLCTRRR